MSLPKPKLWLSSDLAIGYRDPLATTKEAITLNGGTHFLLARNGRGKTTLLRTIATSIPQLKGDIETKGHMQYLPEDLKFDAEIPASSIFRSLLPAAKRDEAFALAERIELDVHKPYGKLSTGNRRKTSLIVAEFSLNPDQPNILLLDEPFSGLDAYARESFEEIWSDSSENTLRLVSCHPDYDSMKMPSALLIHHESIRLLEDPTQTWNQLKDHLN